jgi:hypothetical protein
LTLAAQRPDGQSSSVSQLYKSIHIKLKWSDGDLGVYPIHGKSISRAPYMLEFNCEIGGHE